MIVLGLAGTLWLESVMVLLEVGMFTGSRQQQDFIVKFCSHAGEDVRLDSTIVLPSDHLPDGPPRIIRRTCSHYLDCKLLDKTACKMSITLPR